MHFHICQLCGNGCFQLVSFPNTLTHQLVCLTCVAICCQCAKRWKEIQHSQGAFGASFPVLNPASSKSLSSFLNSFLHFTDEKDTSLASKAQEIRQSSQPVAIEANSLDNHNPGLSDLLVNKPAPMRGQPLSSFPQPLILIQGTTSHQYNQQENRVELRSIQTTIKTTELPKKTGRLLSPSML